MNPHLPSIAQAKDHAKSLRLKMAEDGRNIGHAKSLELVAHQNGFRDWNTMLAAIGHRPPNAWNIGDKVQGTYLAKPFTARIVSVSLIKPGWFRVGLLLEEAVDVVASDGFSNLRTRIQGVVGPKGHSHERTSDGQSHLQIDLW